MFALAFFKKLEKLKPINFTIDGWFNFEIVFISEEISVKIGSDWSLIIDCETFAAYISFLCYKSGTIV